VVDGQGVVPNATARNRNYCSKCKRPKARPNRIFRRLCGRNASRKAEYAPYDRDTVQEARALPCKAIPIRKRCKIGVARTFGMNRAVFRCEKINRKTPTCKITHYRRKGGGFSLRTLDSRTKICLVVASFHVVICWYPFGL
jgi:hypothetical protein